MNRFGVWLVGVMLRRTLTTRERNTIVVHLLSALRATPLNEVIGQNEQGELMVAGRSLDIEKARQLQAHARAAQLNKALNLIREQVVYEAFVGAANKAIIPEDLLFYRAALWWGQEVEKYLKLLAGREEPDL